MLGTFPHPLIWWSHVQTQRQYSASRASSRSAVQASLVRYLRKADPAVVVPGDAFRAVSMPDDQAIQQIAGALGKRVVTFSLDPKYESLLG